MAEADSTDVYGEYSEFYDNYVGDFLDDLPLYMEFANSAKTPVLEIGAGSGRLTLPMARNGVRVVAVDVSVSMLSILNARLKDEPQEVRDRVSVVQADACELDLGESFDLVMVPYYTFNYLLTDVDQKRALERIRAHLSDSGHVLLDMYTPWRRLEYCPPEPIFRNEVVDPRTGNRIRSWNIFSVDKEIQADYQSKIFEITTPGGSVTKREFTIHRHYMLPDQFEKLFTDNGFAIEGAYGGYHREAPKTDSPTPQDEYLRSPPLRTEQMMYVLRKV